MPCGPLWGLLDIGGVPALGIRIVLVTAWQGSIRKYASSGERPTQGLRCKRSGRLWSESQTREHTTMRAQRLDGASRFDPYLAGAQTPASELGRLSPPGLQRAHS